MRIGLIYSHALQPGGYPRDVRWMATYLHNCGEEVTLFADPATNTEGLSKEVPVKRIHLLNIVKSKADVFHLFGLFIPKHGAILPILKATRRPLLITTFSQLLPHTISVRKQKKELYLKGLSLFLRQRPNFHTYSPLETESIKEYFPHSRCFECPNGVFTTDVEFNNGVPRRENKELTILFFGRIDMYQKGVDLLIEGVRKATLRGAPLKLIIAGKSWKGSKEIIGKFIRMHKLQEVIEIQGEMYHGGKWEIFSKVDYLIFPTRFDGPPRPIREAICVGTPVIITAESNMLHLVEEYKAGVGVKLDPEDIARVLERLSQGKRELRDAYALGVAKLRERLDWKNIIQEHIDIYRECLGGSSFKRKGHPPCLL